LVFSSNHQNAFVDPLAILNSQSRIPVFLTQAAVFKLSAVLRWFFKMWYMLPIFRQRDGVETLSQNEEIFRICQDYLLEGRHPIGFFYRRESWVETHLATLEKGHLQNGI
jgi:1-acyl-sn-glycerol-3-phosphate acyltransferase